MTELYLGILSGTSMDAIDVAAVEFKNNKAELQETLNIDLPNNYKQQYLDIINAGTCSLNTLGELDEWTGEIFADSINIFLQQNNIAKKQIKAIGSHGQTIWHAPNNKRPFTMQLGNPHVIAHKTGITTVTDFRRSDMAAGGQGAPLAPLFHRAQFSDPNQPRCIVNIGGLSNISILDGDHFLGFDTGPGNCLLDLVAQKYFNVTYDKNGDIAKTGKVDQTALSKLKQDPYFSAQPPKSTGREYFNEEWIKDLQLEPADMIATLTQLTAETICDAIRSYAKPASKLFICGGGAYNYYLLTAMSIILEHEVQTTKSLGIEPGWVEAGLFAWLAKMAIEKQPIDTSTITGASQKVILGSVSY